MRFPALLRPLFLLCASAVQITAQTPAAPKFPQLNDPALRLEKLATFPEVEACTTVCGDPSGAFYVGNDPRDSRLNTAQPECSIVRFSSMGADRKRTVFAEKLYSPAGMAWHDGWLYVIHDPLLTRFRDTDGDGIADVREDLVTNLGLPPYEGLNDHVVSGFTLGMDGFFYISVGDRGIYKAKGKDGRELSLRGGGIIRVRPDGTGLEIFSTGTRNHLAVLLDAEDHAFTLDNTDDGNGWWTRLTHHIEGGYYGYPYDYQHAANYGVTQPSAQTLDAMKRNGGEALISATDAHGSNTDKGKPTGNSSSPSVSHPWKSVANFFPAMTDFGGGSPTGGLCYLSDGLPEQYRGRLIFSEWGKGNIAAIEVARAGATFRFVKNTPIIQSAPGADFRPMQVSVAADGSLLIADWGWGGWKAPKPLGAIWRLSWPAAQPAPRLPDESKASVEELLAALGHPDRDQRLRAQGELTARLLDDEGSSLFRRIADVSLDRSAQSTCRVHAIWAFRNFIHLRQVLAFNLGGNVTEPAHEMLKLTADPDPVIRAQCLRSNSYALIEAIPHDHAKSSIMEDTDARVRLAGIIAYAHASEGWAADNELPRLLNRLSDSDPWVRYAAIWAMRELNILQKGGYWELFARALPSAAASARAGIWRAFDGVNTEDGVAVLDQLAKSKAANTRASAIAAFGAIVFQPKPYDGKWWGTQPVKNPPPPPSVAWAGTPSALAALTAALSDPDPAVRLAAAKAFTLFTIHRPLPARADRRAVPASDRVAVLCKWSKSAFWSVPDVFESTSRTFGRPVYSFGSGPRTGSAPFRSLKTIKRTFFLDSDAFESQQLSIFDHLDVFRKQTRTSIERFRTHRNDTGKRLTAAPREKQEAPTPEPAVAADGQETGAALRAAEAHALATLRARLTAETDPAVRRQLIEALGVQRDPEAMGVFTAIALDEKAAAEFRDTAISAVVSIGGDAAKQTIAQLAGAQVSPAATRQIIEAAGELRVLEAAPALIARLQDENAGNRQAAVKALAQLGPKANATAALIAALSDPDEKVKPAVLEALGALRDKAALPALLEFAKTKKNAKELVAALAAMPDPQSLPVLVNALRDNNSGLRRNALKALKTMRAAALPPIEEMLASGKIPKEFEPEIRAAFDSGAISKWKMIGPFENVWGAVHPVEIVFTMRLGVKIKDDAGVPRDVSLPMETESLMKQKFENAEGKEVGWRDVTADNDAGHVNLEKVFATNGMVCAYAFAEIESPAAADARLLCGSDDQIAVWLNGTKVRDSGPGSRGYEEDKDDVPLHFAAGQNALLVKIGNLGGGWEFNARIPGLEGGKFVPPKDAPPDEKQRAFVLAQNADGTWTNRGDAKRGEKIFHDPTGPLGGICAQCHKVRGLGAEVGPDLSLVGSVYKRGDLLTSIMEPGKTIALGYEQVMVETKGGETFAGAIRKDAADTLTLLGADQQPHIVKKADIKAQTPVPASIMPPGLTLGLKPEDLADLLAYLESLRGN